MTKRKRPRLRRPFATTATWREFKRFLWEEFVRIDPRGIYVIPALRGFLYEHPVIGLQARRQYWPNLRRHVNAEGMDPAEIVANQVLLPQRIRDAVPGSSRIRLDRFIDIWRPGGPLRITMDDLQAVEEFQTWRAKGKAERP